MIIYFDGVCYLCNSLVNFLIRIDKQKKLKFSPLQSNFAQKELSKKEVNQIKVDSIIVQKGNQIFIKSDAVIGIIKELSIFYRILLVGKIIPFKLRDGLYDYIARHRYKWFGRKNECMIPTEEVRSRFILE